MDNGGYVSIYSDGPWIIFDERDYYAVNLDYVQVAAFKHKDDALEYVLWKKQK